MISGMRRLAFRAMNALTWLFLALLCLVALVQCATSLWGDHVWVTRAWTDQPTRVDIETTWMGLRRQGVVWGRSVAAGRVAPSHPEWLDRTRRFLRGSIGPPGRRMRRWTTAS